MRLQRKRGVLWAALAVVPLLAGCSGGIAPPTGAADYREGHPLETSLRSFVTTLPLPAARGEATLPSPAFLTDYQRRGRGPMVILVPREAGNRGRLAAEELAGLFDQRLIESRAAWAAEGTPADRADGALTVLYNAYVVHLPTCGDWSGEAGARNPTNLPHTNFGCSYQRNIGLMVADPGDLRASGLSGRIDSAWSADVIQRFRAGETTGRQQSVDEKGTVSSVGE